MVEHVMTNNAGPLRIELEGGLVASSLDWEAALRLVAEQPSAALTLPFWALRGRRFVRQRLAERVTLDPASLPYRQDVVGILREQRRRGRRIELQSNDPELAALVAGHLGLNEAGEEAAGGEVVRGTSSGGHHYRIDPPAVSRTEPRNRFTARDLVRALRPHQWAKNLLLIVPLILSHRPVETADFAWIAAAFLAFSLAASFVYVTNDLLDLPSDRKHPTKRNRPFASGRVPIVHGLILAACLIVPSLTLAAALSPMFLGLLLLYTVTCLVYSLRIKRFAILDVLCLSGLYTLRLFAGGVVTGIALSAWLLAFSMFLFLSLAFAKRYVELAGAGQGKALHGRGYGPLDLDMVRILGPLSGYLSVLVICLYIKDTAPFSLYGHPELLWGMAPILLYWVTRLWFIAQRGELDSDPVLFALRDRASLVCGSLCFALFLIARL
jgi:4-hydroxybenzoate polyprenyltransferase